MHVDSVPGGGLRVIEMSEVSGTGTGTGVSDVGSVGVSE